MVSREDILRQAERQYPAWQRAQVSGAPFFPLAITLKKQNRAASYAERRDELTALRIWSADLGFAVEWVTVQDARFGPHERPQSAAWHNEEAWLRAIKRLGEAAAFRADLALMRQHLPALETWLEPNVRKIAENHGKWPAVLACVQWLRQHPRCGLYVRHLPIPGVHTKFIEQNRALLDELLLHLVPEQVTADAESFTVRHGLREEESTIRIRFLDDTLRERCALPACARDLALPVSAFAALPLEGCRAIVTENLRNFLALPELPGTVALLGHGDASVRLRRAAWLRSCRVAYWGDLDLHGFAIFARLRCVLPATEAFMMNEAVLAEFRHFAVADSTTPPAIATEHLDDSGQAVCTLLSSARIRLEQERIPMSVVASALAEWLTRTL
jgi:hypothetical protein